MLAPEPRYPPAASAEAPDRSERLLSKSSGTCQVDSPCCPPTRLEPRGALLAGDRAGGRTGGMSKKSQVFVTEKRLKVDL